MRRLLAHAIAVPFFLLAFMGGTAANAQTTPGINFTVNPSAFTEGQASSTFICLSANSVKSLTLNTGAKFYFSFAGAIGTVTSVSSISVDSSSLAPGSFSGSVSSNLVTLTYNGASASFNFGDNVCAQVNFTASSQTGTGDVTFNSPFTQTVNGDEPFATISIVSFAAGGGGPSSSTISQTFTSSHNLTINGLQQNTSILSITSSSNDQGGEGSALQSGAPETYFANQCNVSNFTVKIDTPQTVAPTTTMTFTLQAGSQLSFDPANSFTPTTNIASTSVGCSITGSSLSCSASGLATSPLAIPGGSFVDVLLTVTPLNTQLPAVEDALISITCK
ncbi:MAG TPA: hypothetical protein VI756_32095 [Blastocatellia bacterium]